MSARHPVIVVTGSSGAGTSSVTRTFQHIFVREQINATIVEGDSFHRYDRQQMSIAMAEADRQVVGALIRKLAESHAVLLIEHDIDRVLALSDRITVLHQGRLIADGAPADVAANPDVVTDLNKEDGLSYRLIGRQVGLSKNTVGAILRRTRSLAEG